MLIIANKKTYESNALGIKIGAGCFTVFHFIELFCEVVSLEVRSRRRSVLLFKEKSTLIQFRDSVNSGFEPSNLLVAAD
jgi:hypothetical protein